MKASDYPLGLVISMENHTLKLIHSVVGDHLSKEEMQTL